MPQTLFHYSFAKQMIRDEEKEFVDCVNLGTQGSDPFFFYGNLPWRKKPLIKEIQNIGEVIHHTDWSKLYFRLCKYALNSEHKEMLFAYIDGLLMHYCVDRNLHPFIFADSGFDENGELKGIYKSYHGTYESILDTSWSHRVGAYVKPSKVISFKDKAQVKEISKMWASCLEYDFVDDETFYKCWEDFVAVEKFLFSRSGWKRLFLRLMGKNSLAWSMSYPHFYKRYEKYDQLNLSHREWKHPVTLVSSTSSVEDLFEQAKKDYLEVHAILMQAKEGEDVEAKLSSFVNNIDHDGCPIGEKKTHYDLFWDRIKS